MSKERDFDNEEMFEQPEFNYYTPPMFDYPLDEDDEFMRSCCQPGMYYMTPAMMQNPMMQGMMPGMTPTMQNPMVQGMMPSMAPMDQQTPVGLEPGMESGLQSPSLAASGINPATSQQQATVFNQGFMQAYLNRLIGKQVRIEFLIGTNVITDRSGVVDEVGTNYIVLRDPSGNRIMGDLYAIKFVTSYGQ